MELMEELRLEENRGLPDRWISACPVFDSRSLNLSLSPCQKQRYCSETGTISLAELENIVYIG